MVNPPALAPLPQQATWRAGAPPLRVGPRTPVTIHALGIAPNGATVGDLRAVLEAARPAGAPPVRVVCTAPPDSRSVAVPDAITIVLSAEASSAPARPEGYLLRISERRIVVAGRDAPGAFWGVQTLCRLVEHGAATSGKEPVLPCGTVRDWPDFVVRGAHLTLFRYRSDQRPGLPFWRALIERVASQRAKLNTLIVQVDNRARYRRRPEVAQKSALALDELRGLCDVARARHIRLVPHLQCLSHQFSLIGPARPEWLLKPGSETYNPDMPGLRPLLSDLMADLRAVFGPGPLHVGLDEVEAGLPTRPGENEAHTFLRHLRELYEDARRAGFATIAFWPDMLARYDPQTRGRRLLARGVPPGVIACPWDYADRPDFANLLDPFSGLPLPVWATGSAKYERNNLARLARAAKKRGCQGLIGSTWNSWTNALVPGIVRPLSGLLLAGEFGWNAGTGADADPDAPLRPLFYDPEAEIKSLLAGLFPLA